MAVVDPSKKSKPVAEAMEDSESEDDTMEEETKAEDVKEDGEQNTTSTDKQKEKKEKKYMVFVGNLPYTAGEEEIRNHFKAVKNYIVKVDIHHFPDGRSRGCCFIEFKNKEGYEKAFKLNRTKFEGRPIRIEYTVPGNNNERRKKYIQKKTKKILGQKKAKKSKWKIKKIPSKLKKMNK